MLAWLTPHGWEAARAQYLAAHAAYATHPDRPQSAQHLQHLQALARWQWQDWPAVVRRRDADAHADEICLGLPLPPDPVSGIKGRIALRVGAHAIARCTPPLALTSLRAPDLAALEQDAAGVKLHVFGSLAMQALTGQPYRTPASDIDLLCYPSTRHQLDTALAALALHAGRLPLDGEIVFPGGLAVAWKEWLQACATRAKVLVKKIDKVSLADTGALLATLEPA